MLWALVNTALVNELSGKGYVVHKMFCRRVGFRLDGGAALRVTRSSSVGEWWGPWSIIGEFVDVRGAFSEVDSDAVVV